MPKATEAPLALIDPSEFIDVPCPECDEPVKFLPGDELQEFLCDDCEEAARRAALVQAIKEARDV